MYFNKPKCIEVAKSYRFKVLEIEEKKKSSQVQEFSEIKPIDRNFYRMG